jgi:hypothetical protein
MRNAPSKPFQSSPTASSERAERWDPGLMFLHIDHLIRSAAHVVASPIRSAPRSITVLNTIQSGKGVIKISWWQIRSLHTRGSNHRLFFFIAIP